MNDNRGMNDAIITTGQDLAAETRAFNELLAGVLAKEPQIHEVDDPPATRAARERGAGPFPAPVRLPEGINANVPGRAGPIPVRVFTPPQVDGVYLHLHGGGWTLGSADAQDPLLWALARAARLAVVSVDYRLAPEHPYPAGPDDCEDAARWLTGHAAAEFGTDRLTIGGESAGAHLAVLTLLRLRARGALQRAFRAAHLAFGAYDASLTPSARLWGERNLVLSTPVMTWFWDQFLPGLDPEQRRDPGISPLYADLRDLRRTGTGPPRRLSGRRRGLNGSRRGAAQPGWITPRAHRLRKADVAKSGAGEPECDHRPSCRAGPVGDGVGGWPSLPDPPSPSSSPVCCTPSGTPSPRGCPTARPGSRCSASGRPWSG